MQSMQRSFGKLWNKGPGDNAKVSVLLSDYEDVDKVLAKIIDSTKTWRDSWTLLVNSQLQIVTEYEGLYDPIVGASDGQARPTEPTPEAQLHRTYNLKRAYDELRSELFEEIVMIEERIIKPATDARDCIAPIRKTIKKRENKRLDYEKAQDKYNKIYRKPGRTPKEDAALAKAQEEMVRATEAFAAADDHLRETLPPIITASFSLVPPLLAAHVLVENRLLGLYYTTLHGYCEENGFPSPAPPMDEVISAWNADFRPVQSQVESIGCIARGKAAHQPMGKTAMEPVRKPSAPAPTQDSFRRSNSGLIPGGSNGAPRTLRVPSSSSVRAPSPTSSNASREPSPRPGYRRPDYLAPTDFTTATVLGGGAVGSSVRSVSPGASPNSLRPQSDYFSTRQRPSTASTVASNISQISAMTTTSASNGFMGKKKPPPPPPPKRIASGKLEEFVVALYTFDGQGQGDLSFREGDRIKIVKKTATDQDWWVGELNGVKGSFPANYCRAT